MYTLQGSGITELYRVARAHLQGSGTILFRAAHDLRDGGRHLAMSLYKLKAFVNYTATVVAIDSWPAEHI